MANLGEHNHIKHSCRPQSDRHKERPLRSNPLHPVHPDAIVERQGFPKFHRLPRGILLGYHTPVRRLNRLFVVVLQTQLSCGYGCNLQLPALRMVRSRHLPYCELPDPLGLDRLCSCECVCGIRKQSAETQLGRAPLWLRIFHSNRGSLDGYPTSAVLSTEL